jgi:predicted TIM-barrel fold metal-dependent hydrolase
MDREGVDRAILVPPVFEGDRNEIALAAARDYPDRFAVMGRLNIIAPDAPERLQHWTASPGLIGIRQSFFLPEHRAQLLDGSTDWFWSAAQAAALPVYVFCPGLFGPIGEIARNHPRLRLVICHLGLAPEANLNDLRMTVEALSGLARHPNIAVTASALPCHAGESFPFPCLADPLKRVVRDFGAERVFWGSDLTRLPCTYHHAVHYLRRLGILSASELDLVMGGALTDWVGWPSPSTSRTVAE